MAVNTRHDDDRVKIGDTIFFRGCTWHEPGWEFDAPLVIYEPYSRYCFTGSISACAVIDKIEDLAIDLCLNPGLKKEWHPSELKEFGWRGWSTDGFKRRRNAIHAEGVIRFKRDDDGGMGFDLVAATQIVRGIRTAVFKDLPKAVPL